SSFFVVRLIWALEPLTVSPPLEKEMVGRASLAGCFSAPGFWAACGVGEPAEGKASRLDRTVTEESRRLIRVALCGRSVACPDGQCRRLMKPGHALGNPRRVIVHGLNLPGSHPGDVSMRFSFHRS